MAYTNSWNETLPQGTAAATTIDDIIRQLKVDIRERMESIVTDWDADPVVPIGLTNRRMVLGPESVVLGGAATNSGLVGDYTQLNDRGSIVLPVQSGWRITAVEALVDKSTVSSLTLTLVERFFNTSQFGAGSYGPTEFTGTGVQIVSLYSNTPGFLVSTQSGWTVHIERTGGFSGSYWHFHGVRVTYNASTS